MNKDSFLSLCDPHNSIIHEFGCEGSCTKAAGICLKGCNQYQHHQKGSKHEFLNAKELYSIVGSIREKYDTFKINFKEVYLKRYMEEVMACVNSFQAYILGDFLEKNPMIDIFCKYSNGGDMFQQVIEEKLDQVQFSQIKCREIFHLKHFEQLLQKQGMEEQQKRMIRFLSKIFEYHLRNQKILLSQKTVVEKRNKALQMIEVDRLEGLIQILQRKVTNLEYSQRQEKVEELLLIVRCDVKEFEKNIQSADIVNKVYATMQNYMEKTVPERLTLAVNFPLTQNTFWDKFATFIGNKGLKQVSICTTSERATNGSFQADISQRYENLLPISIKHGMKWQQISALIENRPER